MYKNKKIIGIIPARGGSKGIPYKNIKVFAGRPLIEWTLIEASKSIYIDKLVVSTEDEKIMNTVADIGFGNCIVKRPIELAQDSTPSIEPVLHVMRVFPDYDYVVLLQVTSPFRTVQDIDDCIAFTIERGAESCISLCEAEVSPFWMYKLDEDLHISKVIDSSKKNTYQRQKLPFVYQQNGALYVSSYTFLWGNRRFEAQNTLGYIMKKSHSGDIDTLDDFEYLEYCMYKRLQQNENKECVRHLNDSGR